MRILIAEDDPVSRKILYKLLSPYGSCDLTVDGIEAVDAFLLALDEGNPYDLICLDVMMPRVDGIRALQTIRELERRRSTGDPAKIIVISALNDRELVSEARELGSEAYVAKPLEQKRLMEVLTELRLIG